jgi:hypothetical protein
MQMDTFCTFLFLIASNFLQSCGDESWKSMAKYCVEDVPNLLKDESLNNVTTLLSHLVESLPANAGDLIKWVIEVRRKEDGESSLSKEEKERLALKVSSFWFADADLLLLAFITHNMICLFTGKSTTASP